MRLPGHLKQKDRSLAALWQVISPRRRRQLLGLQILSLAAAAGEVANLGALLPVRRLLANPSEVLKALGPLATPLRALLEQHLLLSLGLGFVLVVIFTGVSSWVANSVGHENRLTLVALNRVLIKIANNVGITRTNIVSTSYVYIGQNTMV
jgi:hypothetical protein